MEGPLTLFRKPQEAFRKNGVRPWRYFENHKGLFATKDMEGLDMILETTGVFCKKNYLMWFRKQRCFCKKTRRRGPRYDFKNYRSLFAKRLMWSYPWLDESFRKRVCTSKTSLNTRKLYNWSLYIPLAAPLQHNEHSACTKLHSTYCTPGSRKHRLLIL